MTDVVDVVVCGGINVDRFFEVDRLPVQGETILGRSSFEGVGGKGANTAVSCSRMGARTHLISAFGNDSFTDYLLSCMKENQIDTQTCFHLQETGHNCSQAYIFLLPTGDNSIIVVPAVNNHWPSAFTDQQTQTLAACDAILLQREIPDEYNLRIARIAHANNIPLIFDVGGANSPIHQELYQYISILSPNETELERLIEFYFAQQMQIIDPAAVNLNQPLMLQMERLTNIDTLPKMKEACEILQTFNPRMNILLKRGAKGCVLFDYKGNILIQPAMKLDKAQILDTTGAGDTFTGAFVVEWIRQIKLDAHFVAEKEVTEAEPEQKQDESEANNGNSDAVDKDNDNDKNDESKQETEAVTNSVDEKKKEADSNDADEYRRQLSYLGNAMRFACTAAGLSVQVKGTITSIPKIETVVDNILSNGTVSK